MSKPDIIFFWSEGFLSPWYPCTFVLDGIKYNCVEQYMMAEKARLFEDYPTLTQILNSSDPAKIKKFGRNVSPFDSEAWNKVKDEVVKKGNQAKFTQNSDLYKKLIATGQAILAEASPEDHYWGIGLSEAKAAHIPSTEWPGLNMQGKILMDIRRDIINQ